jgi:hypothetical protein
MISAKTTHANTAERNKNDQASDRILVQLGLLHFDFFTCRRFTQPRAEGPHSGRKESVFWVEFRLRATAQKIENQSNKSKRPVDFTSRRAG